MKFLKWLKFRSVAPALLAALLFAFGVSTNSFADDVEQVEAAKQEAKGNKVLGQALGALFKALTPKVDLELPGVAVAPGPAVFQDAVEELDEADASTIELDDSEESSKLKQLEADVVGKPGGKQSLKNYQQRMEGLTREELRFMHELVALRRSQFDAIEPEAKQIARRVALEATKIELLMNQGWNGQPPQPPHVFKMIEDRLMWAAKKYLTSEQSATYCNEIEARQLFRKEAEAGLMLGYIDTELRLTDDQRRKMMPSMVKAWTPHWQQHLSVIEGNGLQFLPKLPKKEIGEVLTKRQNEIFRSVANGNSSFFVGIHANQFPAVDHNAKPLAEELDFAAEIDKETQ